jgi:hypothetical protein
LTCVLDKPLEDATTENAPYKTIDVVSTTLVGGDTLFTINVFE